MSIDCPFISVITPVYNAAKFLPRLVACVKNQEGVTLEHIIVDDCSTDNSLQVLRELAEGNATIRLVAFSKNCGPIEARNAAVRMARGRYLAFLDADDLWLPEKLIIQTRFMEQTGAVLSFTDYRFISEGGELIGRRLCGANRVGWAMHHMTRYLGCLTIMLDRYACPNFSFPDISPAYRAEDFLAWGVVIRQHGPALRCPHDLARYAVVRGSRSSSALRAARSVWALYRKVEQIPFIEATWYFCVYCIMATVKRFWNRPQWPCRTTEEMRMAGR